MHPRITYQQWKEFRRWAQQLAKLLRVLQIRKCTSFVMCQEMLGRGWHFARTSKGQMLITWKNKFQLAVSDWKEGQFYLYVISLGQQGEGPSLTLKFD
jgi:hypothetical protein